MVQLSIVLISIESHNTHASTLIVNVVLPVYVWTPILNRSPPEAPTVMLPLISPKPPIFQCVFNSPFPHPASVLWFVYSELGGLDFSFWLVHYFLIVCWSSFLSELASCAACIDDFLFCASHFFNPTHPLLHWGEKILESSTDREHQRCPGVVAGGKMWKNWKAFNFRQ